MQGSPLIDQLRAAAGDEARIEYHAETGLVRFFGTTPANAIAPPASLSATALPEEAARGFLHLYGPLFGIEDAERELTVMKESVLDKGRSAVRYQQSYQGIPVVGGELIVHMGGDHSLRSINGETLPSLQVDITPSVAADTARQTALTLVAKNYAIGVEALEVDEPELWIYNSVLLGGPGTQLDTLVWRMEVRNRGLVSLRELVLVDAHLGVIALHFNQIDSLKNRTTYDAGNGTVLPGTLRCDETNPSCSGGDSHEVAAHTYAGATHDFYITEHNRDSIDGAGMTMVSSVHYSSGYANAFWNGSQMVYGDGAGFPLAEDVVAHELTHGVTEKESHLFYFYQSGAINESFSDVWGEFVDLYHVTDNDVGDTPWEMGEDISGLGAIRDMADPTRFGDPDRMNSPNYYCEQSDLGLNLGDNGGVHTNSGVNNKAAYLLTAGGSFNGYTVSALGYRMVADLYYEVQTNMLTSAADYVDLYTALTQAAINLGWSTAHRQEVSDALQAVEMHQLPSGCGAPAVNICPSGSSVSDIFYDDIESGGGNWSAGSNLGTAYWFVPQTSSSIGLAEPYATSGVGNIWGFYGSLNQAANTSDTFLAMNGDDSITAHAFMHFNHSYGFEYNPTTSFPGRYDGGVLEYSTDGGSNWNDAGSLITHNGYNGSIDASYGNPLGPVQAFTGDSRGYLSSKLDLSSLAGQGVRFRFRIGTDSEIYDYGWFIDDVRIYTCNAFPWPTFLPGILRGNK